MARLTVPQADIRHVWHPYTQMQDCESLPPVKVASARGIRLFGGGGRWFYDTISSWWCNVHGHGHPAIRSAVNRQIKKLDHVMFAGFTHAPAIELAGMLVDSAPPGIKRVFYSDDGSTAVEVALKMSYQYWHNSGARSKRLFVSLDRGYHGDTLGAMGLGGIGLFNGKFRPLFRESLKVPAPYCYRCPLGLERAGCAVDCAKPLEKLLRARGAEIAAVILEPILLGAGGMIVYPPEYLRRAAAAAKNSRVHLILDEVATGFGRTGRMFACEHGPVAPDFMCVSKGLTGGTLPLAATMVTDDIYRAFYGEYSRLRTFYHGHTFTANPIACAAGAANMRIFRREKTLERAANTGRILGEAADRFWSLPIVGDIRHIGMMAAFELVRNRANKEPFGPGERVGYSAYRMGLEEHLILRPIGDVIYLFLPLSTTEKEVGDIARRTWKVLERVGKKFRVK